MRSYKSIYGKRDQKIIEDSIDKSRTISELIPFLRIHTQEQTHCLEAGSALGSILITFAIMECVLLSILGAGLSEYDDDIEIKFLAQHEWEKTYFKKALGILESRGVMKKEDSAFLTECYDKYRTPLSHGLFSKGIFEADDLRIMFDAVTRGTKSKQKLTASWPDVEKVVGNCIYVENRILTILTEIIENNIYTD